MAKQPRDATFLRILVEGRSGTRDEELAIRSTVARELADQGSGRSWKVGRLFGPVDEDDELARFYTVVGAVDAYALPAIAWDVSYRLADALAGVAVEVIPDLPSTVNAPPPEEPAPAVEAAAAPLPYDWALKSIRAKRAWALKPPAGGARRGAGIRIGHPDTGYVIHPDYEAELVDLALDYDVIAGDDDATDPLEQGPAFQPGHGTRTGSVIAGRVTGTLTGVAPAATLVPIRTVKSVAQFFDGDIAKAVNYARTSGCHVISMSLGGLGFSGLEKAIDRAVAEGVIVMAAAGNYLDALRHMVVWPARYKNCIAVGAVNARDKAWAHSSRGRKLAVSAPGEAVWVPDLAYARDPPVTHSSGTSYSVAHLAGAAALWLAYHGRDKLIARYGAPNLQRAFLTVLRATVRRPAKWDAKLGAGIVDAQALLKAKLPPAAAPAAAPLEEVAIEGAADDLHAVLLEVGAEELDADVAAPLGAAPELRRRTMRRELLYVLTEHPHVLGEPAGGPAAQLAEPGDLRTRLLPYASPTLAAGLG